MAQQSEDTLEGKLEELGGLVGKMSEQNDAFKQKIQKNLDFNASVKTRVKDIKLNVVKLQNNLEKFKNKCDQLQTEIDGLKETINIKEEQIKSLQQAPASNNNEEQIRILTEEVSNLKTKISDAKTTLSTHYQKLSDLINTYKTIVDSIPSDDDQELTKSLQEIEKIINDLLNDFPETDTNPGINNVGAINVGATTPGAYDNQNVEPIVPPVPITKENTLQLANSIKNSVRYNNMSAQLKKEIQVYINQLQGNNNKNVDFSSINKRLTQIASTKGGRKTQKRRRRKTHKKQKGGWKYNKGWKYSNRKTFYFIF